VSVQGLKSVSRGLAILRLLNVKQGAEQGHSLSELARQSGLPRGTVYRMLATLQFKGLVERDDDEGLYHLTVKVGSLSHGYDQEDWTSELARPLLLELGSRINWPVSLSTAMGHMVRTRENTDRVSSLVFQAIRGGSRAPLLSCAPGLVLLAQFSPSERAAVLEAGKSLPDPQLARLAASGAHVEQLLTDVIAQGYCSRLRPAERETEIAVPVTLQGPQRLAALSMRYFSSTVRHDRAISLYVPLLQDTSRRISERYMSEVAP
jgi:IclR family mhp operon transcriptional activator